MKLLKKNESKLWIVFDNNHKKFSVINRLEIKYCRDIFKVSIKIFVDDRIMLSAMKITLRKIYFLDYSMSHIMHFGTTAIQWCKKLIFYDFQSKHRVTFVMKDFVEFENENEKTRLDLLFVHELNDFRWLFATIFKLQNIDKKKWNFEFFFLTISNFDELKYHRFARNSC